MLGLLSLMGDFDDWIIFELCYVSASSLGWSGLLCFLLILKRFSKGLFNLSSGSIAFRSYLWPFPK